MNERVLIAGGAGFIGSALADRFLRAGRPTIIVDDLTDGAAERNAESLRETCGDLLEVHVGDIRDRRLVEELVGRCGGIFDCAARVAAGAGPADPTGDFETNLQGTLNILDAIRRQDPPPPMLFTSTARVYGDLSEIELIPVNGRYAPRDHDIRKYGIGESGPLSLPRADGRAKGAADQCVLDYARAHQLPAAAFRISCVYGPGRCATEDDGWVAHFAGQILRSGELQLCGDGRQVCDILHIDDLVDAMLLAMENIGVVAGRAFNIGGGPRNAVSLLQVVRNLSRLSGVEPRILFGPRRTGDQPYYVSDIRCFTAATGWTPRISVEQGLAQLCQWMRENPRSDAPQVAE